MSSRIDSESLKEQIVTSLATGENSIVGLQRILKEKGFTENRIYLSGYLKALVHLGILNEREIKPSKVYSLNSSRPKDIYDLVGEVSRSSLTGDPGENALMLLNFLFNRPIFFRELEKCNVDPPAVYRKVMHPRRIELVKRLANTGLVVPQNNVLVEPESKDLARVMRLLRNLVINGLSLRPYLLDDTEFRQATLD
ncbi:MAG TPA: hypothetical protein VKU79_04085 [Thermoplasmataceae archaeon]|nr:hypothetical protein [Thermoplasmatales archaeon AK]HLH86025.1 hypothetical protein [Thermoplasmataceae archaeon]